MEPGNEKTEGGAGEQVLDDDGMEIARFLMAWKTKPISDSDAIYIQTVRQQRESPISDEQLETQSCQDTISWRGSPAPEGFLMSPPKSRSPSDSKEIKPTHGPTPQPVEHGPAKRGRGTGAAGRIPTASVAKISRQKKQNSARTRRAATTKLSMTAEQKKGAKEAREAKIKLENEIYQPRPFKRRDRGEVGLALNAIGAPLPAAGVPAELSVNERKPRSFKPKPKQE